MPMGVGRIFSREWAIVDFPGVAKKIFAEGAKSGEISLCLLRNLGNNLFCENFDRKMSNFKIQGGIGHPLPPLPTPMPPLPTPMP